MMLLMQPHPYIHFPCLPKPQSMNSKNKKAKNNKRIQHKNYKLTQMSKVHLLFPPQNNIKIRRPSFMTKAFNTCLQNRCPRPKTIPSFVFKP